MKQTTANGVTAVLLVLLLLTGALVVLPSWHANASQAEPTVRGFVYEDLDASGNYTPPAEGLVGIRVSLNDVSNGIDNVDSTLTVSGGYFQMAAPNPSYYEVVIRPDVNPFRGGKVYFTYTSSVIRLDFNQNESLGDVPLSSRLIDSTLTGNVTDALGDPLVGATVTIIDPVNDYSNSTTSGANGAYSLDFYNGTHQIQVTYPGYSQYFTTLTIDPQGNHADVSNTPLVSVDEITSDGQVVSPLEYSWNATTGRIDFSPPLPAGAFVLANYTYTGTWNEILTLASLGGETQGFLANGDILNLTIRDNGTVWWGHTLIPASGIVNYNSTLPPQMSLTATYNYSISFGNGTIHTTAVPSETSFSIVSLGPNQYLMNESLTFFDGAPHPMNESASPGPYNYLVDRNTGLVTTSAGWDLGNAGNSVYGFYNYSDMVDYQYLTTTSTLSYPPIPLNSETIWVNGAPQGRGINYTVDEVTGEITFLVALYGGDVITTEYPRDLPVLNEPLVLAGGTTHDVTLFETEVTGRVFDAESGKGIYQQEIRAVLYDEINKRTLTSTSDGPLFTIGTYDGTFTLTLDSDGYASYTTTGLTVSGGNVVMGNISLDPSEDEVITNHVSFAGGVDWNSIQLDRTWSLNADSSIFGLDNANVNNLRLQIDSALGNGDLTLTTAEIGTFLAWLENRGPRFVVTRDVLTVDDEYYRSNESTFAATFEPNVNAPIDDAGRVWINTTAMYDAVDDPEPDLESYTIVVNGTYDMTGAVYTDHKYVFDLPTEYELIGNTTNPPDVSVTGFRTVTVDPGTEPPSAPPVPTATLSIQRRLNGTARAEVVAGTYHPLNTTWENYTVIVRGNENITFSAEQSTDPNIVDGKVSPFANFTWDFGDGDAGYGIKPVHNYTAGANYTVNLTVTDPGDNQTFRDISVSVDMDDPVASADVDSDHEMDGAIFVVDEDTEVIMNGTNSTDTLFGTVPGIIDIWEWDFDSDETVDTTGEIISQVFSEPGEFNATLRVTDVAGHESAAIKLDFRVADTTPPEPAVTILNESYVVKLDAIEDSRTYFDASETTDNFDSLENLTFRWDFGDDSPVIGPGAPGEFVNVTHNYTDYNLAGYELNLTVEDRAGNNASINTSVVVRIKSAARPDLQVLPTTFEASPQHIEQGQTTTLSVLIRNGGGRGKAESVQVQFSYLSGGQTGERVNISTPADVRWFTESGNASSTNDLEANETKLVEVTWSHDVIANYTIFVNASTDNEWSGDLGDNEFESGWVVVTEAGYVRPLIYVAILLLIIAVPVLIWLRRKYQRGEISFRRREREEGPRKKK